MLRLDNIVCRLKGFAKTEIFREDMSLVRDGFPVSNVLLCFIFVPNKYLIWVYIIMFIESVVFAFTTDGSNT